MNIKYAMWISAFFSLTLPSMSTAAVTLQGTRIVFDSGKGHDVSIQAENRGDQAALVQVWIDTGDSNARPEDLRTPFRLTPSEPRLLQAHQGQAFRITYAPRPADEPLPSDRESVLYFNLLDIPPKPAGAGTTNLLQFAIRTRIKLFHRPAGLRGDARDAAGQLVWTLEKGSLRIVNPSAYHVTLSTLSLPDGSPLELALDMIAPGQSTRIPLPSNSAQPAFVSYQWLDDYGAQREGRGSLRPEVAGFMPSGEGGG